MYLHVENLHVPRVKVKTWGPELHQSLLTHFVEDFWIVLWVVNHGHGMRALCVVNMKEKIAQYLPMSNVANYNDYSMGHKLEMLPKVNYLLAFSLTSFTFLKLLMNFASKESSNRVATMQFFGRWKIASFSSTRCMPTSKEKTTISYTQFIENLDN